MFFHVPGLMEQQDQNSISVHSKEFHIIAQLYLLGEIPELPSESFKNAYKDLLKTRMHTIPPWEHCIPKTQYVKLAGAYLNKLHLLLDDLDISYYHNVYKQTEQVFDALQPAKINVTKLQELLLAEPNNTIIQHFQTNSGYTQVPVYDRLESVSGRMRITNGPNILLLQKEHRSIIESRFGSDGNLWYLDFNALEPRVLLSLPTVLPKRREGREIPSESDISDLYNRLLTDMGLSGTITRSQIKKIVLSIIYGAGHASVVDELKDVRHPEHIIQQVEDYFEVDDLKCALINEAASNQNRYLTNCYGRRVSISSIGSYAYINRIVQSAAVDVGLFGFKNIIELITDLNLNDRVVPLFVLHDGLILDVHQSIPSLTALCKVGASGIPEFQQHKFPIKVSRFL